MDLQTVRQNFVILSGRYDLITDTESWGDNGANLLINAGMDMLDKMIGKLPDSEGNLWKSFAIGDYYHSFQNRCRAITEVWAHSSTERTKLEKKDWTELRELFPDPISETDQGQPLYYCPSKLREIDVTDKDTVASFFDHSVSTSKDYRGIFILPPPDEAYDIQIIGLFSQPVLENDTDENVWTILHPYTLIKAAIYQAELFTGSTAKLTDLLNNISSDIFEIGKDVVEEDVADPMSMEG